MDAQYYYIDPESQKTRGPFGLEDVQRLLEQKALDRATMVCRVVAEEWRMFDTYPELVASPHPLAPELAAPRPRRPGLFTSYALAALMICSLVAVAGFARWKAIARRASGAATTTKKTLLPALPPSPIAAPEKHVERGVEIARRLLEQHPKLKVAVISGITFPKPDGIELYGTGAFGASISFILPEESWNALSENEKLDLQAYVAGKVAWVRDHAEDYMIIPRSAPDYEQDVERARHLVDGAWRIGSTQTYPDDPDGNLYLKRILVKGPAY